MAACGVQREAGVKAAATQRLGWAVACAILAAWLSVGSALAAWFPPLDRPPLDPPLRLSGSFGEYRGGHLHAGLDLSTDERVGRPVYASLKGRIVRVRASGVGYGRSIYLQAEDGRLLVYGHLDAFDEPFASYVAAVQDSSGQYEQDLWPDSTRFPVAAGLRLGWSGRSGTGPPHLHFEIRRGDIALNPLFAGVELRDQAPPTLRRITFEPLDDASSVEGGRAPLTVTLDGKTDGARVELLGRVRAIVEAAEPRANGRLTMAPWSTSVDWGLGAVECRFDSVSWADGMSEVDFVYDEGRAAEVGPARVLWAPAGFRPRALHGEAPLAQELGTIETRPGDPPRPLVIVARDASGGSVTRRIELVAPAASVSRAARGAPAVTLGVSGAGVAPDRAAEPLAPERLRYASLPGNLLRVELPAGDGRRRAEILRFPELPLDATLEVRGAGRTQRTRALRFTAAGGEREGGIEGFHWAIPRDGLFEPAVFVAWSGKAAQEGELSPVGPAYTLGPLRHPLRSPLAVMLEAPEGAALDRVSIYHDGGEGWEFVRARIDSGGRRFAAESRHLGRFALFRDASAPRIALSSPERGVRPAPYPHWAIEARLSDAGSDVDARASYFEIDGRRVPSEWDADEDTLRFRPLRAPARGRHAYRVIAIDRAGNRASAAASFVLN